MRRPNSTQKTTTVLKWTNMIRGECHGMIIRKTRVDTTPAYPARQAVSSHPPLERMGPTTVLAIITAGELGHGALPLSTSSPAP